jgi:uncharacterized repeat protein (TIGR03803 family)
MKANPKVACGLLLVATATCSQLQAATLNVLYNFAATSNGANYPSTLVQGGGGNFYGTTTGDFKSNYGTVFELTPAGALTTLASFNGANGAYPYDGAGLVQGTDGNFYGTTPEGGSNNGGTVFKVTPAGVLTTLVSFRGSIGVEPEGVLVQGNDGNFYGTTDEGGSNNVGTVFKMTPAGALTTLASFNLGSSGGYPTAGLVQGSDGNFYGTTSTGGPGTAIGTVFEITPSGAMTILAALHAGYTHAGLVQGNDGNFYGVTFSGGFFNDGSVFKVTPAGVYTTMASFNGANGNDPEATLIQGSDGNFYGTTYRGGGGYGTVFSMTPEGALTVLASFDGTGGINPLTALVQGSDGNFYGTTSAGGTSGGGVAFQLIVSPPPVPALPRWGKVALALGLFIVCTTFLRRGGKLKRGL